jgi:hypothetical protein
VRRLAAGAAVTLAVLVAAAAPAGAHTLNGVGPTDYRSEILGVDPPVPGLRVRLLDLGRRVEVANAGRTEVVVLGYQGEPYLRVGPAGVFENERSPALYLNRVGPPGVSTTTTLPRPANPTAAPSWRRVSGGHTVRWRDRRTRWEGPALDVVRRAPGVQHVVVPTWTVELRQSTTPIVVTGRISWVPPPARWPAAAAAIALFALTLAASRVRRPGPLLAAALSVLVAVDVVRSVGDSWASPGSLAIHVVGVLFAGMFSAIGWVIAVAAMDGLQRGEDGGLYGAAVAGLVIAVAALGDAGVILHSQAPSAFPSIVPRAAVCVEYGLGFGLAAAGALSGRRALTTGR